MRKSGSTGQKNNKGYIKFDWLPVSIIFLLVVFWQVFGDIGNMPSYILPTPVMVIEALYQNRVLLLSHTLVTTGEALIGFGLAVLLGIASGILMGYYQRVRRALYPLFVITQTIPIIVLTPLFAIWFGFGLLPKVLIVILVCFFPIAVTFTQGLIEADENMDALLQVMGASRWQAFFIARIPQALPDLFSGLKIAATYSIMGAVISEWVGAQKGLGIYMTRAMTSFKTSVLFADVLMIVLLSLGLYKLIEMFERHWQLK
ncbi:MAG TPA: ABC transporter permease [Ruminiclostridium sp.]|nr:ABC transporter permease [Ruminiclostridium sp.]